MAALPAAPGAQAFPPRAEPAPPAPDDDDDRLSDTSDIDPDSAVLAPVQERIARQLLRHVESLSLELHETTNEARMMRQRREDCGVELYNVQQHLAKLQEGLERGHDNLVAIQQLLEDKERERATLQTQCSTVESAITDQQKKYLQYQQQLDKLNETLLTAEQFNRQIQSEIGLERRAAYKAEDDIQKMEREKARQDALIDSLNERIKHLSEQHALLASQVAAQKQETKLARDTLAEALAEMEAVEFEKKQLLQNWRSSLVGMQRRDEALRATEDALTKQKEQLLTLDNEIVGYREAIRDAQTKNAKLSSVLSRTEGEVSNLEKQIDALLARKAETSERFTVLQRNLVDKDNERKQADDEARALQAQIDGVKKKSQRVAQEIIEVEDRISKTLSQHSMLKKGSEAALADAEVMKNKIREKEMHVEQMENELARIRVDTLQTQAHNDVLRQTVAELEKELQSRDALVEKMQLDIRRKHDEIERKQKQLDALNRQYETIVAQHGSDSGDHVGPMEATINNLSKKIAAMAAENELLQKQWIKLQTELVNTKNSNDKLQRAIRELKAQNTILQQKRGRLLGATNQHRAEIAELERSIDQMHHEMKKLNQFVNANAVAQEQLANEAFQVEGALVQRLQDRKKEALQLEQRVETVRADKAQLLSEIVDAERDVMFWEKKIQIARETELALDPHVGKDEIQRMKREIYIMEQRLAHLQREQRRKVEEMQKLVEHRDVLRTKGAAIQAAAKSNQRGTTKATVSRENQRLAAELEAKKREALLKDAQIRDSLAATERCAAEAEQLVQASEALRQNLSDLQRQFNQECVARDRAVDEKARRQRALQRFRDAERGVYKLSTYPEDVERQVAELEQQRASLVAALAAVAATHPAVAPELAVFTGDAAGAGAGGSESSAAGAGSFDDGSAAAAAAS
jgi:chromosome segregation ATPase